MIKNIIIILVLAVVGIIVWESQDVISFEEMKDGIDSGIESIKNLFN